MTVLLPNPGRASRSPAARTLTLGLRVPDVPALPGVRWPVLQSSANLAGGPEARRLSRGARGAAARRGHGDRRRASFPAPRRRWSTCADYEDEGHWRIVRRGAICEDAVAAALGWQFHFDPDSYEAMIRDDIPVYDELQERLVARLAA